MKPKPVTRPSRQRREEKPPRTIEKEDFQAVASLVCKYFCSGVPPAAIPKKLERYHGIHISRELPYKYLAHAAANKWLLFAPPAHIVLEELLRAHPKYSYLRQVDVVDCAHASVVMERAAKVVLDLISQRAAKKSPGMPVRIGFAGGHSMALLAHALNTLLNDQMHGLPDKIVCHNLVAGFDNTDPRNNPISFLSPLMEEKANGLKVECVLFQAPATVRLEPPGLRDELLKAEGNRQAVAAVRGDGGGLDIIVNSCGSINDPHQMLGKYYNEKTREFLRKQGCVGDMGWLPVRVEAPFRFDRLEKEERMGLDWTMSLIALDDLPGLIEQGTEVVLAVGPCLWCGMDKADITKAILEQRPALVTRLVADPQCARYLLQPRAADSRAQSDGK